MSRSIRALALALAIAAGVASRAPRAAEPTSDRSGEWTSYAADLASTRYKPFDQINKTNFSSLEVAWRLKTDAFGPRPEFNYETTPLMLNGIVTVSAQDGRFPEGRLGIQFNGGPIKVRKLLVKEL